MEAAETPLLQVDGLCKSYGDFSLKDVSLEVPAGCVVGLVGANGAGKTTTLKCLLGLARPDSGSIRLLGRDVTCASPSEYAAVRERVGVVFDTCAFPEVFRACDIQRIAGSAYPAWDGEYFQSLLERLGVPARKPVKALSRGTGMKLSLAVALAARPSLLVLDEATAGLDPLARDEALSILRAFMEEGDGCEDTPKGILMSSHITSDIEKLADYVVCVDSGSVVFSAETCAITDSAGIAHCRASDLEALRASGAGDLERWRCLPKPYCTDVLVHDRRDFSKKHPGIAVEKATVDDCLAFALKGERL